jgi:phosphatidylinositol alpha-1,6-mannosyltransferase
VKILLISLDFLPDMRGGIELYYHHLARQMQGAMQVLTARRAEAAVFDQQQPYRIYRRAVPLEAADFRRRTQVGPLRLLALAWTAVGQFLRYTWHGCQLVRRERIDLVLIGQLHLAPVGWLVGRLTGRPYAISLHGSALSRYWHLRLVRWPILALLNQARFLMVNSDFTRRQYLERGVRANQRFVRVYPGVEAERFAAAADPQPIVRRHGLAGKAVILTVARLIEWKGQDMVIRALPRVLAAVPNAVYVVVGQGSYLETLRRLTAELGLAEQVIFAGLIPDEELPLFYAAADVVVMTSREIRPGMPIEGFGMVYLEANAAGRAVVGTRLGGAPEAVLDGITGLLVDPTDPTRIAEAIVRLLTNPDLAGQMGQAGRARAMHEFTWENQVGRLQQQLTALITTGNPA